FHGTGMNGKFFVVAQGALHHFALIPAAGPYTAGSAFNVTIQARDRNNNLVPGAVAVNISNPTGSGAVFSPNPITLASNGTGTFSANIRTSGSQQIHVQSGAIGGDVLITVNPSAIHHFTVAGPSTATTGANTNYVVTAFDPFNNIKTDYAGLVRFSSTDGTAVLPAN